MSERDAMMLGDDLELITRYLNNQLSPADRADVERRLSTDQAFYEYVEPMLFAWTVAQHEVKKPRPEGELEEMWDKFTKEAGFVHQKKRAKVRRLWILGIIVAVIGTSTLVMRDRIRIAYSDWRDYVPVAGSPTGWMPLRQNIQVRLEPDAQLSAAKELRNGGQFTKLAAGTAHFRVQLTDSTSLTPAMAPVVIRTRATEVYSGYGDFSVTVRGDTTDVEDLPPERPRYIGFMPFPSMTMVRVSEYAEPIRVQSGERVRLITGQPLQRIP